MKTFALALLLIFSGLCLKAQNFDWLERQENMQASLGQTVRIPIVLKNTSDRAQWMVIRKVSSDLGNQQKGYFCINDDCLDPTTEVLIRRLEAGESLSGVTYTIETGLQTAVNTLKFEAFARSAPGIVMESTTVLNVEEKVSKSYIFQSRDITVMDVYPNPVSDLGLVDYRIHNEAVKAKLMVHNILGSAVGEYEMPSFETRVKIQAEDLASGVYFYTVYIDNIGIMTRKLVVRK